MCRPPSAIQGLHMFAGKVLLRLPGMPSRSRRRGSLGKAWKPFVMVVGGLKLDIVARRGWGYSLFAFHRPDGGTVLPWGECSWEEMKVKKKKKPEGGASTHTHLAALETVLLGGHHSIVKHCAVTRYDDGDPRQPGWITLKTLGGVWQIEAKDPDTCQFLRVQQPSLDDAITLLALLLDSDEAPWEHDPWAARQKSTKKK